MSSFSFRRDIITRPIFSWAHGVLPAMSDTEREALEAGDVWWDADLFTGNPDWSKLLATAPATLTLEEQAFLTGPVDELCGMLDDWKINWEWRDLPPEAWDFIKAKKFFGMIIPKEFGGLGFSPYAHSEVVRKISTRSVTAAVTVMVPNSLGPGELLMRFGTREQQQQWLPRLADGREIPCFGLTSPEAGSDAASMIDSGIICKGTFEGREMLGLRLNWHKRYITLGPVATLLGLAFKAYDPDHLVGSQDELGITVALIPTHLAGVEIGRRHLPSMQVFQNGPNWGRDVFIPMDYIIGGEARLGQGWKMLMTALAAGRGISLPSLSAAGAAFAARTTGAYARIREQFNVPIGKFEGIEEPLARIAATAYLLDAARRLTCAALNQGRHPAVISGIMKLQATERMRVAIDDAMDVHGGKAVIDGPQNYMGSLYRSVPVGITVEGANILTRNLIVFGQGAIRAHPFLLDEMNALGEQDRAKGLDAFDKAFWKHIGHSITTLFRAWGRSWTFGALASAPDAGDATGFYRQLSRYSSAFALCADMALLTLGGALKRKEMLSARFGDILSELYLLSAALKRWQDEGRQPADFAALEWCMASGFKTIENRFAEILANLPNRFVAALLKFVVQPFGARVLGPSDRVIHQCAQLVLEPSAARDRLTPDLSHVDDDGGVARLEKAFLLVTAAEDIARRLRAARIDDLKEAVKKGVITQAEANQLATAREAVAKVIEVDDFAPEALSPIYTKPADVHRFFQELGEQKGGKLMARPVFIIDGSRTPFLKARSGPGPFTPVDLAVQCGRPLLARQPFAPTAFDQVILGCVNVIADEMNPARVAALRLGMGEAMVAFTVQINCGSGMQSIDTGYRYIREGVSDLILAGGAEALSYAPLVWPQAGVRWFAGLAGAKGFLTKLAALAKARPAYFKPVIGLERGLTDPITELNMGQTAEVVGHLFGITRAQSDAYAAESHKRLAHAQAQGFLKGEVEIAFDRGGKFYDHDDGVRPDSTPETLARLKPVFERPWGQVTAGNSSQITDGACWTILASEEAVKKHGLVPKAVIVDSQWSALDPSIMGLGPVLSATELLKRNQLSLGDIETWELNEAFATQVLGCLAAWNDDKFCREILGLDGAAGPIDPAKLNVDGGAISLGHPVGCSGNRIVLHLVNAMKRLGTKRGIATECIGGGQGGAMLIETV